MRAHLDSKSRVSCEDVIVSPRPPSAVAAVPESPQRIQRSTSPSPGCSSVSTLPFPTPMILQRKSSKRTRSLRSNVKICHHRHLVELVDLRLLRVTTGSQLFHSHSCKVVQRIRPLFSQEVHPKHSTSATRNARGYSLFKEKEGGNG